MTHTFWSWLIRCVNMKWIWLVLWKIQSRHDMVGRTKWNQYTSLNFIGGYKNTTWMGCGCCHSGHVLPTPGVVCRSMVGTVKSLAWELWELVCIKALSLAHCSSSWKHFCMSSVLMCHENFSTLMTRSSCTPMRSVSPSSRHERMLWKAKGRVSTWNRISSLSPALALVSSRIPASAVVVLATTPLSACSVICGSTAPLLIDWCPTQIISSGVRARLGPTKTDQWPMWMSENVACLTLTRKWKAGFRHSLVLPTPAIGHGQH